MVFVFRRVLERTPAVKASEVEVAFVVVEFSAVKFWSVEEPVVRKFPTVSRPATNELVKEPMVAKKEVEVALVEVLCSAVKFCKVEEAMEMKPAPRVVDAVVKRPWVKATVVEVETP